MKKLICLFVLAFLSISLVFAKPTNAKKIFFNKNIYERYLNDPRPKNASTDAYYRALITPRYGETVVADLVDLFKGSTKNDNELVELIMIFVQRLEYNLEECQPGVIAIADYPYVTLFRGTGTCWDKALLCVALLKEAGFDAVILYFKAVPLPNGGTDQHVAVGLASDSPRAINGWLYMEVSSSALLGYVPKVTGEGSLGYDSRAIDQKVNKENFKKLGPVVIYLESGGKKYSPLVQSRLFK